MVGKRGPEPQHVVVTPFVALLFLRPALVVAHVVLGCDFPEIVVILD